LAVLRGLMFELCVYQLCVILIMYYFNNMFDHDE